MPVQPVEPCAHPPPKLLNLPESGTACPVFARNPRSSQALSALGGHAFALDSDTAQRLQFEVAAGGGPAAFAMGPAGGPSLGRFARTP
ncbi:MAG TPA: hypothetical protein VEX35_02530 [Allosphingosinicella sp.]|nr:hypothetical protein [Allosphingosinicella sp.]